ncbi:MAG: class I SAM-dependent methyltransferase [Candidatus Sericytochromatia bacterium]|nr:class I SAM-dependent methyltransferase [Candidatus Sericytochromatia bacterium]
MSNTPSVQAQYTACPYPPLEAGELPHIHPPAATWDFVHYYCSHRHASQEPHILDAGCGTGFSTLKLARANPSAKITAVDLSPSSLKLAQQRLKAAGISCENIQFLQGDLTQLNQPQTFDYIYCTGVLHHMPDPAAGLAKLKAHLKPRGLMTLMLYNPHARHEIRALQKILHSLWQNPADLQEGLMLCRTLLHGLPEGHPFKRMYSQHLTVITQELGPAFAHSDAFLVDTYLQVCEQEWELSRWWQELDSAGLQILRFFDEASWEPGQYLKGLPDYYQERNFRERCCLLDPLRRANNYLFVVGHGDQAWRRPALAWHPTDTPCKLTWVQSQVLGDHFLALENQLGSKLELAPLAHGLWEKADGKTDWETLIQICHTISNPHSTELRQALERCAQQLLDGYFVWNPVD